MATDPHPRPSFSPYRKWGIGLHVLLLVLVVLSVLVMVNYLSREYFLRFHLSTHTKIELFPRTVELAQVTHQPGEGDALLRLEDEDRSTAPCRTCSANIGW